MDQTVRLCAGHMLCICDGAGVRISVQQGEGVITQEQDADDTVFMAGAAFTVQRKGKTIVMARRETILRLGLPSGSHVGRIESKKYVGSRAVVLRKWELPRGGWLRAAAATVSLVAYRVSKGQTSFRSS
jgi:hypothetical protein